MTRWRRLVWGFIALLAFGVAVMAVLPSLVAPLIAARLSTATGAAVRIGWISWNPLIGRVVLHRVEVAPTSGDPAAVVTVGSIGIDVAVRRWIHGERALDALVLRRPWVSLQRTGPGDFNLATLFPAATAPNGDATATAEVGPPNPFRIRRLRIVSGSVEFRDETTTPVLETSLHLDDASARDLVLAGGGTATLAFHVESRLEQEPLTLDVSYESAPDSSHLEATLTAKKVSLARALLYVPLGWQRTAGSMDVTLTYERRVEEQTLRRHGLTAALVLRDLALTEPWAHETMLRANTVSARKIGVDFMKQRTDLGVIQIDQFQALVLRDKDGIHVPLATGSTDTADSTWETTLDRVSLGKGAAVLRKILPGTDVDVTVPVNDGGTIRLSNGGVTCNLAGAFAGGRISLFASASNATTHLQFGLENLALPEASQLLAVPLAFASGRLNGNLGLTVDERGTTIGGTLSAADAKSAPSREHPEEILAWQQLDLRLDEGRLDPLRLVVGEATATWPYVMVHRRADGWFPLTLAGGDAPGSEREWFRLKHLDVKGGRIEFYDTTLPKAYGIDLTDLTASATDLSLSPLRAEHVALGGALDELSPLQLIGTIRAADSTMSLTFDRLLLPPLNPYVVPALGYAVRSGLARTSSVIRLSGSTLDAQTDLVLSRFAMQAAGPDVVEARIGTPLSVALALMKDTRGDIHLTLPIHGDIAAQEYRVGSLFREALGTALLGTLRAPLGFLRGIFSKDEGERFDLRPVPFAAGTATLDAEGANRVDELARLLGRQMALRAVLIPEPSRADATALPHEGDAAPLKGLTDLSRARAEAVLQRLTSTHGIEVGRVSTEPWDPGTPTADDAGVDVQLRIE